MKGDIAEIMIYARSLEDSSIEQVVNYLRDKYAPSANLGPDREISYGFAPEELNAGDNYSEYLWSTGDTSSSITASTSGIYTVSTTDVFGFNSVDSIEITFPAIQYQVDTTICLQDTITWNTGFGEGYTFLWHNASTGSSVKIGEEGENYVKINDTLGNFILSDTIFVQVDSFPLNASLGNDSLVCDAYELQLEVGVVEASSYLWNDASTDSLLIVNTTGNYWLSVVNSISCVAIDTIYLEIKGASPYANFEFDTVCFGDTTSFFDSSLIQVPDSISMWNWNFDNFFIKYF